MAVRFKPRLGGIVTPQAASNARPQLVVLDVLEARQPIRERAHVAAALDVVLAAERVEAAAPPPDVPAQQREVDQRQDVVDRVVVLGDAQGPADHRLARPSRRRGRSRGWPRRGRRSRARRARGCTARRPPGRPRSRWWRGAMNSSLARPAAMISRPIALASAMSVPTSRPSHRSAHSADVVRRGSTAYSRAPLRTPFRRWWKKIGCVSRALLPQRRTTSVSSISRYELVPPPAPNTVARPATEGACQVRLQLSMLLLPRTTRESFWAAKLISLVDLLQLKTPNVPEPCASPAARSPRPPDPAPRPSWLGGEEPRSGGRRRARAAWSGGRTPSALAYLVGRCPIGRV